MGKRITKIMKGLFKQFGRSDQFFFQCFRIEYLFSFISRNTESVMSVIPHVDETPGFNISSGEILKQLQKKYSNIISL